MADVADNDQVGAVVAGGPDDLLGGMAGADLGSHDHALLGGVGRGLLQQPGAGLHHLARLLTQATDLHQIARGIASDLHQRLDSRPTGQPGPSTASTTEP